MMSLNNNKLVPDGWKRTEIVRKKGVTAGKIDTYIYSPNGKCFRSRKQLLEYIDVNKLPYHINDFTFNVQNNKQTSEDKCNEAESDYSLSNVSIDHIYAQNTTEKMTSLNSVGSDIFETESSENLSELSDYIQDLSESIQQLKHDKEKTETSLKNLEIEANISILDLQKEIEALKNESVFLKQKLNDKDKEITFLKNQTNIEAVTIPKKKPKNQNQLEGKCTKCCVELKGLENKLNILKRENLQLMETIQPCPLPDKQLTEEIKSLTNKLKHMESNLNEEICDRIKIIEVLSADIENLTLDNGRLRSENCNLKRINEEISAESMYITSKKVSNQCRINLNAQQENKQIELSNRYNGLSNCIDDSLTKKLLDCPANGSDMKKMRNNSKKAASLNTKKCENNFRNGNTSEMLLLSDSHGRHLFNNLTKVWPSCTSSVCSIFKPNAGLSEVVRDIVALTDSFTLNDSLIVIGGTNDDIVQGESQLYDTYTKILQCTTHTNVVIAGLPYRHNVPGLNNKISFINIELEKIVLDFSHAYFLPINKLPRHMYTRHGLHFNKRGKHKIACMIKEILQNEVHNKENSSDKNLELKSLENLEKFKDSKPSEEYQPPGTSGRLDVLSISSPVTVQGNKSYAEAVSGISHGMSEAVNSLPFSLSHSDETSSASGDISFLEVKICSTPTV